MEARKSARDGTRPLSLMHSRTKLPREIKHAGAALVDLVQRSLEVIHVEVTLDRFTVDGTIRIHDCRTRFGVGRSWLAD